MVSCKTLMINGFRAAAGPQCGVQFRVVELMDGNCYVPSILLVKSIEQNSSVLELFHFYPIRATTPQYVTLPFSSSQIGQFQLFECVCKIGT